jgi:glycosyltransferase involved in cell wall biosynthesis
MLRDKINEPGLTILIPVFNVSIETLINAIVDEIKQKSLENKVAIICLDDCSTNKDLTRQNSLFVSRLRELNIFYFVAKNNSGRSKTRNKLVRLARTSWLLFLDADVLPDKNSFLSDYFEAINADKYDVVCGGTSYLQRIFKDRKYDFYYDFMTRIAVISAQKRNKNIWKYLLTSNVLVRKLVLQKCKFNKSFKTYGYEDQEWAIRIKEKFRVIHIDNTVSHLGLQTKDEFLEKFRVSIKNYHLLIKLHPEEFFQTPLGKIVTYTSLLPLNFLVKIEKNIFWLLKKINCCLPVIAFLYQINKVFLMSIYSRRETGDNQKSKD